jgi:hypothetical protein
LRDSTTGLNPDVKLHSPPQCKGYCSRLHALGRAMSKRLSVPRWKPAFSALASHAHHRAPRDAFSDCSLCEVAYRPKQRRYGSVPIGYVPPANEQSVLAPCFISVGPRCGREQARFQPKLQSGRSLTVTATFRSKGSYPHLVGCRPFVIAYAVVLYYYERYFLYIGCQ